MEKIEKILLYIYKEHTCILNTIYNLAKLFTFPCPPSRKAQS